MTRSRYNALTGTAGPRVNREVPQGRQGLKRATGSTPVAGASCSTISCSDQTWSVWTGILSLSYTHRHQTGLFFVRILVVTKKCFKMNFFCMQSGKKSLVAGPRCMRAKFELVLEKGLGRIQGEFWPTSQDGGPSHSGPTSPRGHLLAQAAAAHSRSTGRSHDEQGQLAQGTTFP